MTILNLTTSQISTIDETTGLQNFASSTIAGDKDDNDILASALPAAFAAKLLGAGIPINAALSGYNGSNSGGNAFSFSLSGAVGMGFTDSSGAALNGVDSGLKTDAGDSILLYTDGSDNNVLYGKVGSTIVFAAYLEEQGAGGSLTGAKMWMAQYQPIQHPDVNNHDDFLDLLNKVYVTVDTQRVFSLENAPSGQNLFMMFGDSTAAIIVTGKNPANQSTGASITTGDTVNTSQGGGGTTIGTNNQMIDPSEGMYFTFVTGANSNYTVPNLNQNEADVEANIDFSGMLSSNSASFKIVQLQKDKTATIKISAMNTALEKGVNYVDGLGVSKGDTAVAVDFVQVRNAAGLIVEKSDGSVNDAGISIAFSAGAATIVGVKAGYTIEYHTVAGHNRMLVDNAGTGTNDKASFDIGGFTLLQGGQSTAEIGSLMHFEDDGPAIALATPTDTTVLNTQDAQTIAAATDTDSKSFAAAFALASSSYGADGAGDTSWSYALSVGSQGMDSDLKSHGATVYLYLISGVVVGSTSATEAGVSAANTVLQVQVDAAGVVTLSQMMQIDHAQPGASSNYAAQQAELANGKIGLTATALITDYDGDTASAAKTLDLGGNLKFDDDGPAITQATPTDTTVLNTQDAQTIAAATDTDSKSFAAAFALASSSYGADGAGDTSWSYALTVGSQGMDSDLKSHGATVYLYLISGVVVGSTSATEAGVSAANTVLQVQVDAAGVVTLSQMMQIDHAQPGASSNYAAQQAELANGKIGLTATALITDYDGDTASAAKTLDLGGNLKFDDDGPAITQATPTDTTVLNTQDAQTIAAATDTDSKSFAAAFALASSSYGADGAGDTSWSYALSVGSQGMDSDLKSHGATVYLYLISGAVVGSTSATEAGVSAANTVLQVQVDAAGVVTLSQMMQIDHAQPGASSNYAAQQAELANGKIGLTATALITDYDGDTASAAKTLDLGGNLKFDDDGPFVVLANPVDNTVLLCQDAQTIGSATDSDTKNFAAAFAIASSSYGADGAGGTSWSYAFQLTSQGLNSGLKSHGDAIYLYVLSGQVVGSTSATEAGVSAANTVFDIQVDSAGVVTMEQMMQVDHALPGDTSNYDAQEATLSASQVSLVGTVVLTDYDGDMATASKALDLAGHLRFADDGPSPFTPSSVTLLNSGSAVATGNLNATGTIGADVTGTAIFVDGKAADDFLYKSDGTTLLKSGGENIVLSGFGSDTLIAKTVTTQQTVFTAKLLFGTDQYTIDFDKAIDDGSGVSFLGAAPVKSGNPTFNLINNVAGTTLDLLFSGSNNNGISTVNVSTNGAGVANQTMNVGENLRIDFGTNLALAGSPLGSDFTLGMHQTVNGYSFLLSQNTPSGTTGTAYIKVYDADNDKALTGDADDVADTITQVKVNGIVVYGVGAAPSATINSQTVMAFAYQGGVIITGLNEGASGDGTGGDDPRITVYTADGFNRVETTNYAGKTVNGVVLGGTDFDIGPAGVEQAVAGAPFSFQLPVQTVDYDGDLSPVELIGVNISPV